MSMMTDRGHREAGRPRRIVIVGGGITGLATAYRLQAIARDRAEPLDIIVLEREARLGGKIQTEHVGGFTIEAGPDIFLARKPRGVGLCRELSIDDRIQPTNPDCRGSYIQRNGALYRLPEGLSGLIPTRLGPMVRSPLLSPWGKLRMALDWLLPARAGDADESIADFISRRLGKEVYEQLVEPLLGGIYGAGGHALSLKATFPHLRELERTHGSLLRGLLAKQATADPAPSRGSAFVTMKGGMGELIATLASQLNAVRVCTDQPVSAISKKGKGYRVLIDGDKTIEADAIVVTTPAYVAGRLVEAVDIQLADELRAIPYGSTATLSVAFNMADVPRPLDAYGYLIPRSEAKPVRACTWTSTKIPGRAPEGMALIRVFLGRTDSEEILEQNDGALLATALAELKATLGITAIPLFRRIFRWPRSMPQYVLGHPERLERITQYLKAHPGLFIAGSAYRGVGIPDCIEDGENAAQQALAFLFMDRAPSFATPM